MPFTPGRLKSSLGECLAAVDAPVSGLCVALSGGLDSSVLLAALVAGGAARSLPLRAIHVDHGLHADSPEWSKSCARLAAALSVPLDQVVVDARPGPGESPEAAARAARYSAIAARLRPGEVLLTAHHADDQVETVLLQWLRGGGLRAVAGMSAVSRFRSGWHARPMLGFTRAELEAWARAQGMSWLSDSSNQDPRLDRNYLRLEVLPAIRMRWPAVARTIGRVAAQAAESLAIEEEIAGADLAMASDGDALSLERLDLLPGTRRRWVLRAWLRALGLPVPSLATLAALVHDMSRSAADRVPCTNWPGARVYRYRARLFAVSEDSAAAVLPEGDWPFGVPFDLGALGRLEWVAATGTGLSRDRLPPAVRVRRRGAGEHFVTAGSSQHRPLRKWLQERGVLPWRRGQVPLVCVGDEIIAVGDLACAASYAARPGEPSWVVAWRGRPAVTEREVLEVKRDD